jgi:hypothetical protein
MAKQAVWKYIIRDVLSELEIPAGGVVVAVREQLGTIAMWVRVDPLAKKEKRKFVTVGTGHEEIDPSDQYLGSSHLSAGSLVFHVFERPND